MIDRRLRQTLADMKQRCLNAKHPQYKNYGARGITICAEWLNSAQRFADDMGERPDGMTIDRKNNDGPYCKDNCRWATKAEQRINQRTVRLITVHGETKPLRHWALAYGIKEWTLHHRIFRMGMSPEVAVTTPIKQSQSRNALAANAARWAALANRPADAKPI
jgi:hypothetical protein